MLHLDQRGDDHGDSLEYLQLERVEIHPELDPLDSIHNSAINRQRLRVSPQENLQGDR